MSRQPASDLLYKGQPLGEFDLENLLADLGYELRVSNLEFVGDYVEKEASVAIENYLEKVSELVVLTQGAAHREFLTAPILYAGASAEKATIRRFGTLAAGDFEAIFDFWLRGTSHLLVETRHDDLEKGFARLVLQLVVLDLWDKRSNELTDYFGAVAASGAWRFVRLRRQNKTFFRDPKLHGVPPDVSEVFEKVVLCLRFGIPGGIGAQVEPQIDVPDPDNG